MPALVAILEPQQGEAWAAAWRALGAGRDPVACFLGSTPCGVAVGGGWLVVVVVYACGVEVSPGNVSPAWRLPTILKDCKYSGCVAGRRIT